MPIRIGSQTKFATVGWGHKNSHDKDRLIFITEIFIPRNPVPLKCAIVAVLLVHLRVSAGSSLKANIRAPLQHALIGPLNDVITHAIWNEPTGRLHAPQGARGKKQTVYIHFKPLKHDTASRGSFH